MPKKQKQKKLLPTSNLTEAQIDDLELAFDIYDLDDDGIIASRELGTVLRQLGRNPTEAEIQEMIREVDTKNSGTISFEDFAMLMSTRMNNVDKVEDVLDAFRVFDINGNGFLSTHELRHVMTNLGEKLSEDEANEMIRAADADGDGLINYNDFINLMVPK